MSEISRTDFDRLAQRVFELERVLSPSMGLARILGDLAVTGGLTAQGINIGSATGAVVNNIQEEVRVGPVGMLLYRNFGGAGTNLIYTLAYNCYYDGASWRRRTAQNTAMLLQFQGPENHVALYFATDAGTTVDSIVTFSARFSFLQDGTLTMINAKYTGALISRKNSTDFTGYAYVPLAAPLVSTDWDGDAKSTTAKTLLDLSTVFGAPAGIKAVDFKVIIRDSGSAAGNTYLILGPENTANKGKGLSCAGLANDAYARGDLQVPCNADGDVYFQIAASGSGTMDVWLEIWGYWL